MRPEPPANYRPAFVERTGIAHLLSHTFRIAIRDLERKPMQAFFTVAGLALATGILIVPNCFRDGIAEVLDYQWHVVQRQDISVGLVEPSSVAAQYPLRQLPGVTTVEPFRTVAVRLHCGHRRRQLGLRGLPANPQHDRVINADYQTIVLPPEGLVLSAKLAQILGAQVGDQITVEVLEERRPIRSVPLVRLAEDFAGVAAYMDRTALNRLLGEGDVMNAASFRVEPGRRSAFLHALKETPRVNWVAIKESMRLNFRETTAASINTFQGIYLVFATVVAFGVVYNNVRISLAERARELATLRVIGFARREVGGVLVTELVILALIAVPIGLVLGAGLATVLVNAINTETVRLPVVLRQNNFAFAVLVVSVASTLSALFVLRQLHRLDLVGVLKAPE
jgi:putative ABC transport system permease protein